MTAPGPRNGTTRQWRSAFTFGPRADVPIVTTAIHAGHDLRPPVAAWTALDEDARLREEDPFTDRIADVGCTLVTVHRSRFEVDINRPRDGAVYTTPDTAWGLDIWREPLPADEIERSLDIHDAFYATMGGLLDRLAEDGPFVVLDVHSYNHRRGGPHAPPEPADENPEVNVGTGSLDRGRWGDLVDRFVDDLGRREVHSRPLDVRENVRFQGGHLSHWVNGRYDGVGCALALEFKKVFMDEWTGVPDDGHLRELTTALSATLPGLLDELR